MGYVSDKGRECEDFLAEQGITSPAKEVIVAFIKRAILESYHNGQRAPHHDNGAPQRSSARRTYKR